MRKPKNCGQPCPNKNCEHYGQLNKDNIISLSTYMTQSGKRRIFHCNSCETNFSETRDTVFFDLKTPEDKVNDGFEDDFGQSWSFRYFFRA